LRPPITTKEIQLPERYMAPQMVDEVSVSVAMDWEKLTVWFQHISCSHRIDGQRAGQTRRYSQAEKGKPASTPVP
jgi:hypothetical protein